MKKKNKLYIKIFSFFSDRKLKLISCSIFLFSICFLTVSCAKDISLKKEYKKSYKAKIVQPIKNVFTKKLTVISNPPGARVYIDDVFQGVAPITLEFNSNIFDFVKGFSIFVEKKGFLPARRKVDYNQTRVIFNLFSRN